METYTEKEGSLKTLFFCNYLRNYLPTSPESLRGRLNPYMFHFSFLILLPCCGIKLLQNDSDWNVYIMPSFRCGLDRLSNDHNETEYLTGVPYYYPASTKSLIWYSSLPCCIIM